MRVYISGPIDTHVPGAEKEELLERFNRCEAWIEEHRPHWRVVNPVKVPACLDCSCSGGLLTHTWECYLRHDLVALLGCDAIVFLPNHERSRGASLEEYVARALGFIPMYADVNGKVLL